MNAPLGCDVVQAQIVAAVTRMVGRDRCEGTALCTKVAVCVDGSGRHGGRSVEGSFVALGASETSTEPMLDYSAFLGFQLRAEA